MFEAEENGEETPGLARVTPVYGLTQGVAQRWLRARIEGALRSLRPIPDPVPAAWKHWEIVTPLTLTILSAATDGISAARIEEEVILTPNGAQIISLYPAEELPIANPYRS